MLCTLDFHGYGAYFLSLLRYGRLFHVCLIVGHYSDRADMQTARSSEQARPASTEMPALPGLGRNRLKAAQLMEFIQRTAHRPPLETQEIRQFLIREQRVSQQQA